MIQLRTLGSIDLVAPDRPGAAAVLAQPKRFALLVYLAVAAPGGFIRRDTVLALFWPETDQTRGRNVLRQTVYLLRQTLGSNAVTSRGDEEIGVDPDVVQCDVVRFEAALSAGQTSAALDDYRGEFLNGFHVPDAAPELDEWIRSEARRLRSLAGNGAWSLALSEEATGEDERSAQWARRALALDPFNEKRVGDVMALLGRLGDRAGALQEFHEYARRAEADLGIKPNGEVQQLAASLTSAPTILPAKRPMNLPVDAASASPRRIPAAVVQSEPRSRWRDRRVIWGATAVLGALALGVPLLLARVPDAQPIVAVGTITDASGDTLIRSSNVPADLLSTSLARMTGLQVIPVTRLYDLQSQLRAALQPVSSMLAAARQADADQLIEGTLHRTGPSTLQLDLQIIDARTGSVLRAHRAQGADLFAVIDEATTLIAVAYDLASPREGIAQVTTPSLVAYRFYGQGLQAYYQDDLHAAYRLFRAALAEDTSFAMAAYYAGLSARTSARPESEGLLLRAARLAGRATDRERLLILVGVAELGMSVTASALADTLAVRYPLDPDAQLFLGSISTRSGDFIAAARQYRRVITMDSLSLTRDARCLACDAYEKLWWSYLYADSAAAAERVAREFATVRPSARALGLVATTLVRRGRPNEAWAAWRTMDSLQAGSLHHDLAASDLAIREGDFAAGDDRLRRLLREGSTTVRDEAGWYLVLSLRTQGRHREALILTDQLATKLPRSIVLLELGRFAEAATDFEAQMGPARFGAFPGHTARHHAWMLTHTATSLAAAGDTLRLSVLADTVEQLGKLSAFGRDPRLHHYIRGLLWNARGQPARAADEFRNSVWSWSEGYTRANYELARTLIALKKPTQAVYPLQAALRGDVQSSNLYITRTELHELLAQTFDSLGQRDSAAAHYRQVVNAWRESDPPFTARRNAAQQRLSAVSHP